MNSLTLLNPPVWNAETVAVVNARLETASAGHIADWAVATFGRDLIVAASMQDTILPHLFGTRLEGVATLFLDTGYHFAETLATRDEAARQLPITVVNASPRLSVADQDAEHGPRLHDRDPEQVLRKVEPLGRALEGRAAWVTGLRRADGPTRANAPVLDWDARHGIVKINPLALWSDEQIEQYQTEHALPRNPLVARGYPSIGCAPCTRAVKPGEDARAGRWSGTDKTECGLHA